MRWLQYVAFAGLTAVLGTTSVVWMAVPADHMRWGLTPVAFFVVESALSLLFAFTLTRRPAGALVGVAVGLIVVSVLPALSLDLIGTSFMPTVGVTLSAACIFAALIVGRRGQGARNSTSLMVIGVLVVLPLAAFSMILAIDNASGGRVTFVRAASRDGRWVATGFQLDTLATSSGHTEVVVRRDVAGLFREQMSAFSSENLGIPRVAWMNASHLVVGKRVITLSGP